jgi:carboxyl-terminal processing protease
MTSRIRALVLAVSIPVIVFAVIGGYLGQAMTREDTYRHLRVFEDVVSLVLSNYVEEVDVRRAMKGAMNGLADGLDPDSAYLAPEVVKTVESSVDPGPADVGLELVRQYYLRVVSARDNSPAAAAGLRPGDYVRAIDGKPTRDMSAYEGNRLLHGAPGSKVSLLVIRGSAADPHVVDLIRQRTTGPEVSSRMAAPDTGYIRVAEFSNQSLTEVRQAVQALGKTGATQYVIDLRGTTRGDIDDGIATARLFVRSGTLTIRQGKGDIRESVSAQPGDGTVAARVVLLVNQGTSGAAEVFAAALDGNGRADLVGQQTVGRAARQRLVKLPDGSALWLSHLRYLAPSGDAIHQRGLTPDVEVEEPEIEFGATPPTSDETLRRALEYLSEKKAA